MNKKLLILFLCVPGFQPFINAVDLNQIVQRQEVDSGAPVLSVTDDNSIVNRALKTLWVGFEYTSEQKDTIRKEIVELERQKAVIKGWITDLLTGPAKTFPTEDHLQKRLKEVEEKIYKKKLAIGDVWSTARRTFVLATVAALGFGIFKYLKPAMVNK
jgi:hypothetical protein